MDILLYIYIFITGTIIGSFLNVCIYRLPEGKSLVSPPSACSTCGHRLGFLDLIPVFNYVFSGGKCRHCGAKYSAQYPLIELLNGLLYLFVFYKYGFTWIAVMHSLTVSVLIVVFLIDLRYKIIPDSIIIFGLLYTTIISIMFIDINFFDKVFGFGFGFGLFLLIALITNAMGGGDIKLMGFLGLNFGLKGIIFITVASFVIGAVVSVGLLISKIATRKDYIPFGPFIAIAAMIYIFWGEEIINMYFNLIL
ncbi:MAG: prepilin peptidase [Bacillota bacterium]|nr:prepilin peptidase [Bacillota bacterium]